MQIVKQAVNKKNNIPFLVNMWNTHVISMKIMDRFMENFYSTTSMRHQNQSH